METATKQEEDKDNVLAVKTPMTETEKKLRFLGHICSNTSSKIRKLKRKGVTSAQIDVIRDYYLKQVLDKNDGRQLRAPADVLDMFYALRHTNYSHEVLGFHKDYQGKLDHQIVFFAYLHATFTERDQLLNYFRWHRKMFTAPDNTGFLRVRGDLLFIAELVYLFMLRVDNVAAEPISIWLSSVLKSLVIEFDTAAELTIDVIQNTFIRRYATRVGPPNDVGVNHFRARVDYMLRHIPIIIANEDLLFHKIANTYYDGMKIINGFISSTTPIGVFILLTYFTATHIVWSYADLFSFNQSLAGTRSSGASDIFAQAPRGLI